MNRHHLQRIQFLVRKIVGAEIRDNAPYVQIDAIAEEVAQGFAMYLRLVVLGVQHEHTVAIDVPDGRWQALKAAFGLRFRSKTVTIHLSEIFPTMSFDEPGNYVVDVEAN